MNSGIGADKTREDHRQVADQLYAALARGRDLRRLVSIVGESALSEHDRLHLAFADAFERRLVHQRGARRAIDETLDLAWDLPFQLPESELRRIDPALVARYGQRAEDATLPPHEP